MTASGIMQIIVRDYADDEYDYDDDKHDGDAPAHCHLPVVDAHRSFPVPTRVGG